MSKGNATSSVMTRLLSVILFCGITVAACDSEDEFVCPASGIDQCLVGEWMGVDNEGNLGTLGLKITADGSCYALGVNWATGLVGVAEEYCFFPKTLPCLGKNTVLWTCGPNGPDTVRYEVTANMLKFYQLRTGMNTLSYVRLMQDQQVRQPVVSTISWTCDSTNSAQGLHTVAELPYWFTYPCYTHSHSREASITILGYTTGRHRFTCFIHEFNGPGTYTLGSPSERKSQAGIGNLCSDVAMSLATKNDNLSTVTIASYDSMRQRISGSFDLLLSDSDGIYMHIIGSFDSPIDQP